MYSYSQEELYHYGVLGMKWGVHRARKRAASVGVSSRSTHSTGENYDKVLVKMRKEKDSTINKKHSARYMKMIDDYADGKIDDAKLKETNARLNREYYKESMKLVEKYKDEFNKATLKDINYKDVEKGMELLRRKDKIIFNVDL